MHDVTFAARKCEILGACAPAAAFFFFLLCKCSVFLIRFFFNVLSGSFLGTCLPEKGPAVLQAQNPHDCRLTRSRTMRRRHAWRSRQLASGCSRPKSSSKGPGPRNPHAAEVADGDVLRHRRRRRRRHLDHRQVPAVHRGHPAPGAGDPGPKNSKNQKVPAGRLAVIAITRVLRQRAPVNGGTWRMNTSTQSTPGSRSAWRKCGGH